MKRGVENDLATLKGGGGTTSLELEVLAILKRVVQKVKKGGRAKSLTLS